MDCPTTWGAERDVVDICDMLVAAEEVSVTSLSVTEKTTSLDSRPDHLRPADVAETGYSSVAAGRLSNKLMEAALSVESEVAEGLGVMGVEGVAVEEAGGSVGAVVPAGFAEMITFASGREGLVLRSVSIVEAVAAVVASAASVHISVSEASTVLEGAFESGSEFEATEGGVVAVRVRAAAAAAAASGAAAGLSLGGVFISPSSIWDSSFSGVLRPDVVGGGPGLRTGFGSKAGFPADSCADTLGRI